MIRQWFAGLSERPAQRDAVTAGFWLLLGLALLWFGWTGLWARTALFHAGSWVFLVTLCAMAAISTQRSTRPLSALAAGVVVTAVDVLFGGSLAVVLILTDLIYCAMKYGSDRNVRRALRPAVAIVIILGSALALLSPGDALTLSMVLQSTMILGVAGLWGWNVRAERVRTSAALGIEHAESTSRLRQRVAHDLHDLVANQIAVAGLHIEAARLQAARAVASAEAAAPLEQSLDRAKLGTDRAHLELRRLIAALGALDELTDAPPQEIPEAIRALGEQLPAGRSLRWGGDARTELEAELERGDGARAGIVLRVLRELLANAVKHGSGEVEIRIDGADASVLRITVTNGRATLGTSSLPGSGIGLRGAGLLLDGIGGRLKPDCGLQPGAWSVSVTLPRVDTMGETK